MNFFHRHEFEAGKGAIQFSVANMMQKMIVQLAKLNELVEQKNAVLETKMIEQMAKLNSNMERLAERRSKPSEEEARA